VLDEQLRQSRLGVDQARGDAEGRVNEAEGRLAAAEAQLAQVRRAAPPAGETSSATEHCGCPARRGWGTARRQALA